MTWHLTQDVSEYLAAAGDLLRSRPAENTILLTVVNTLQARGPGFFGDSAPLLGWWQGQDGEPCAAFVHTPPYQVVLTAMPDEVAGTLAGELAGRGRSPSGVNADIRAGRAFAAAWTARTGQPAGVGLETRLYRLGTLRPPSPAPDGRARVADAQDRDLLISWLEGFHQEAEGGPMTDAGRLVEDRLSYGGLTLWEAGGQPVSMGGQQRLVAGQVRVGPVYTPPDLRGRGYGGAVTAAVTRAALDAGAAEVLLFTDLANPTSNALYQRLGYQPVSDRVMLTFDPAGQPE